jgi:penicillin-binding protein 1C
LASVFRRALIGGAGLIVAVFVGAFFGPRLPDPLFDAPHTKTLFSSDGRLIGATIAADEQWRFPSIDRVPHKFRVAVTRFEDRRFDAHWGVDPYAIVRAFWRNTQARRIVSGASTITMQVVRLARGGRDRTYPEKAIEAMLALRLDARYEKEAILALYASHAPYGGNIVGLSAAVWRYFGRPPDDLSWAEAALLAVLPKSPSLIHPGRNRGELVRRRDALLRDLESVGAIGSVELALALREDLPEAPRPLPRLAPHLLASLSASHPDRDRFETTLDYPLQTKVIDRVERHGVRLASMGIDNLAVVVFDNATLSTLAYVGNARTRFDPRRGRAVDMINRPRSTGSILKPLLYAAMLESGDILPKTLVPDVPTNYSGFSPENFDRTYRGAVAADVALARSLNVPAVRMLGRYGVERFQHLLRRMGLSTLDRPASDYGLTLILGGGEATLWEVTSAYAMLARLAQSRPVESPRIREARVLTGVLSDRAKADHASPIGAGSAWLTLEALSAVERPEVEGEWRSFVRDHTIAWKTGTSYGLRDAWAVGTTGRHTVGVWAGNATGEGIAGLSGLESAGPVLFDVFGALPAAAPISPPLHDLDLAFACADDGYLANELCDRVSQLVPKGTHFATTTPHHVRVHTDARGEFQLDSRCASVFEMKTRGWFVLPPSQEYYYRRQHPEYQAPPAYHPSCEQAVAGPAMELLYPNEATAVYIPIDLDGRSSEVVFEAVHREREATLHWHLDDRYLASTRSFHQLAVRPTPGSHRLTIVDERGHSLDRVFRVLGEP